jgi:hypothetical protein
VIVIKELLIRHTEPLGASKPAVIAPQFDPDQRRVGNHALYNY